MPNFLTSGRDPMDNIEIFTRLNLTLFISNIVTKKFVFFKGISTDKESKAFRILLLGAPSVGKTAFAVKLTTGRFIGDYSTGNG